VAVTEARNRFFSKGSRCGKNAPAVHDDFCILMVQWNPIFFMRLDAVLGHPPESVVNCINVNLRTSEGVELDWYWHWYKVDRHSLSIWPYKAERSTLSIWLEIQSIRILSTIGVSFMIDSVTCRRKKSKRSTLSRGEVEENSFYFTGSRGEGRFLIYTPRHILHRKYKIYSLISDA